jgi:hypothetical protein
MAVLGSARGALQERLATSRGLWRDIKGRALGWFARGSRKGYAQIGDRVPDAASLDTEIVGSFLTIL